MDDALGVSGFERRRDLDRELQRLLDREGTAETLGQRLAFD